MTGQGGNPGRQSSERSERFSREVANRSPPPPCCRDAAVRGVYGTCSCGHRCDPPVITAVLDKGSILSKLLFTHKAGMVVMPASMPSSSDSSENSVGKLRRDVLQGLPFGSHDR